MLGCTIADVTLPSGVSLSSRTGIAIVVIDQQQTVLIDTGMLVAIELTNLAAFLYTEEVLRGSQTGFLIKFEISSSIAW